ncbi:MAG: hypothetical protein ACI90V_011716 [Bacillariaceae sp.]
MLLIFGVLVESQKDPHHIAASFSSSSFFALPYYIIQCLSNVPDPVDLNPIAPPHGSNKFLSMIVLLLFNNVTTGVLRCISEAEGKRPPPASAGSCFEYLV